MDITARTPLAWLRAQRPSKRPLEDQPRLGRVETPGALPRSESVRVAPQAATDAGQRETPRIDPAAILLA